MVFLLASSSNPAFLLPSSVLMLNLVKKKFYGPKDYQFLILLLFLVSIVATFISAIYYSKNLNFLWITLIILASAGVHANYKLSPQPFSISLFFFTLIATLEFFFYDQIFIIKEKFFFIGDASLVNYSLENSYGFRISGFFHNPNTFAISIILILIGLCVVKQNKISVLEFLAATFCIILSGSRAGFASLVILFIFLNFSNRSFFYITVLSFPFISIFLFYIDLESFRVLDILDLITLSNQSSSQRVEFLNDYLIATVNQEEYFKLFFGNGYFSVAHILFDSDVGNFIFGVGIFGFAIFMMAIILVFARAHSIYILLALMPILIGGGIYGNARMCLFMILLTSSTHFFRLENNRFPEQFSGF